MKHELPSDDEIRYHGLMRIWERDTMFFSVGINRHPSMQEILKLRDAVDLVPLIFWDLLHHPHQCFPLLRELVPDLPPVSENMRGRISEITTFWFEWAKSNGRLEKRIQ